MRRVSGHQGGNGPDAGAGAGMQLDDAAMILGRADFFEICDAEQRRVLAHASERRRHRPGTVVYRSGEVPDGAHVLISGTVATTRDGGEDNPFLIHNQGAVLGAMALVLASPRPVTVKAIDAVETLFVPRAAFMALCQRQPELAARAAERIKGDLGLYLSAIDKGKPRAG